MWYFCQKMKLSIWLIMGIVTLVFSGINCVRSRETGLTGELEVSPEAARPLVTRHRGSGTAVRVTGVKDKQIQAVLNILDAREDGDVEKTIDLMRGHRLTPQKLGDLISDMTYSVMDAGLARAKRHFDTTRDTTFSIPEYNFRITRNELNNTRARLDRLIKKTYEDRGGVDQFKKNQIIVLRYEKEIWEKLWRVFASKERTGGNSSITIRTNEP